MDSTGAGIIRAGLDVIVTVIVCGVLFIVLPLVPKGQTPSARNKKKKDLARRRQSEHKFGRHEQEEEKEKVVQGRREVTGRLTNI